MCELMPKPFFGCPLGLETSLTNTGHFFAQLQFYFDKMRAYTCNRPNKKMYPLMIVHSELDSLIKEHLEHLIPQETQKYRRQLTFFV